MHSDSLIKMANQIGSFFEAMPDRDEALHDLVLHIRRSWAPRMRTALLAHVDGSVESGLSGTVIEAIARHRAVLA